MLTVGAYQAKTRLSELLNRVAAGDIVTITRRGRPIARLVPVEEDAKRRAAQAADQIRARRARLRTVPLAELLRSIHEGHRH